LSHNTRPTQKTITGETMSNPYELRLDLFNSARDLLVERYNAAERRYDAAYNRFMEEKERYITLKEQGKECGEYPSVNLPDYPIFPSDDDITNLAYHIKNFTMDKEGV